MTRCLECDSIESEIEEWDHDTNRPILVCLECGAADCFVRYDDESWDLER